MRYHCPFMRMAKIQFQQHQVLARIQNNTGSHSVLAGMQNCLATLESSFLQN